MTISENNRSKKNKCIFTAITAGLALSCVSDANSSNIEYSSSKARFISIENYDYPIDFKIENIMMEAGNGGGRQ